MTKCFRKGNKPEKENCKTTGQHSKKEPYSQTKYKDNEKQKCNCVESKNTDLLTSAEFFQIFAVLSCCSFA